MSKAVDKARAISALLDEYGISNDSLEQFIKEAENLPSSANLDKYNELVEDYNNANGYEPKKDAADDLVAFYDSHTEELSSKQHEITQLKRVIEANEQLKAMYEELDALVEDGGAEDDEL